MNNTPVTIISGYLGAGKTTLVNHLLRNPAGKRLAILVNDFGDLPIDADLIEAQDDDLISLSGGCVCCSYGNGMVEAFLKLQNFDPMPDHVILEASGVAIPSAMIGSLSIMEHYYLEGVVCLVDAAQIQYQSTNKYLADTIEQQLSGSDIIVINKVDLVTKEEEERLLNWLDNKVSGALLLSSRHSTVETQLLLQAFHRTDDVIETENIQHNTNYHTKAIIPSEPVEPQAFIQRLLEDNPGLLRAKGFVATPEGDLKTIQIVGERADISEAPIGAKPGVVVISLYEGEAS